jgi:serine/threonine-protein kinase
LSWNATKPFKVSEVVAGPSTAPVAEFKHGKRIVRMTVTCSGGVPTSTNSTEGA